MADGLIAEVKIKESQAVEKGDLLVCLDDEEIVLELQAAEVRLEAAKPAYEQAKQLFESGQASQEQLLEARSAVQLAELDVRRWQLRLERTRILSPADGKVMMRQELSRGQKVSAGDLLLYIVKQENELTGRDEPGSEEDRVGDAGGAGAPE